ncbi:MAG: hypothetical protein WCJ35_01920 [Planctomycetota bacterium]
MLVSQKTFWLLVISLWGLMLNDRSLTWYEKLHLDRFTYRV